LTSDRRDAEELHQCEVISVSGEHRWARALFILGSIAMLLGALDPLEGSVVILAGSACAALGATVSHSRDARLLSWAFGLVLLGVGSLWAWSAVGGFGGDTGRSIWWALTIVPYPIGWLLGLAGVYRHLRQSPVKSPA
jgi:hypothetical protein